MENILYYQRPQNHEDDYMAVIGQISSEKELYEELRDKLAFPFFGDNWDALDEFYQWFFWIKQHNIHIYHEGVINMPYEELNMYIHVVCYACEWWETNDFHKVYFYFKESEKTVISPIVKAFDVEAEQRRMLGKWIVKTLQTSPIPSDVKTLKFHLFPQQNGCIISISGSQYKEEDIAIYQPDNTFFIEKSSFFMKSDQKGFINAIKQTIDLCICQNCIIRKLVDNKKIKITE